MKPLMIAFVAGAPALCYAAWAIFIFKSIGRNIAIAQGRTDELDQPDREGFNDYEADLYQQLRLGRPPSDIPPTLAIKARRVGHHLKWSMRIAAIWIAALVVVYWFSSPSG